MAQANQAWTNEMTGAVRRFPLPLLCAVALTYFTWPQPGPGDHPLFQKYGQISLAGFAVAAFFWSWAAALWGESRDRPVAAIVASLLGILVLAYVFELHLIPEAWLTGAKSEEWTGFTVSHTLLLGGLALAPAVAPYLARLPSQSTVWQYNHKWVIAFLAAFLGALLANLSYLIILSTTDSLFNVKLDDHNGTLGSALAWPLIFPWIWLALSPRDFTETAKTGAAMEFTSRAVALLVSYILIPVATVLSLLLAAYVVKILLQGSFNTARLGLMSLCYGIGIMLVALMAYPQREESRYVGLFWRTFPFLLIAPSVLFFPALWIRVSEYGWTPWRYFALILGVWAAAIAVISLLPRLREDLRLIPGLLAVLLAMTAFGPWGVADVSAHSQYARLERLLTEKGWLVDGQWKGRASEAASNPGPFKSKVTLTRVSADARTISSALETLKVTGDLDRLRPWFAGQPNDPFSNPVEQRFDILSSRFKAGRGSGPLTGNRKSFSASAPYIIAVPERSTVIGPLYGSYAPVANPKPPIETSAGSLHVSFDGRTLTIQNEQEQKAIFDYLPILHALPDRTPAMQPKQTGANGINVAPAPEKKQVLIIEGVGDLSVKLAIISVSGRIDGERLIGVRTGYYMLVADRQ